MIYARAAKIYRDHGWPGVLPLPPNQKAHPPAGHTGTTGQDPTDQQIDAWCQTNPDGNIALRLPPGIIGIDIDAYGDKHGDVSLLALEAELGPLPATWKSSSRPLGRSGIYLYRVPPGRYQDKPAPSIEIIQHHHRYVVVMPSIHPEGRPYLWWDHEQTEQHRPPRPEELAELPETWVVQLAERPRSSTDYEPRPHAVDDWTPAVTRAFTKALLDMPGGRHDAALHGALALARLESLEHPGALQALRELAGRFAAAIADRATPKDAEREWYDIIEGAYQIVKDTPPQAPKWEPWTPPDPRQLDDYLRQAGGERQEDEPAVHVRSRLVPGGDFALDLPDTTPAIWGVDAEVLWAEGESMLIVGPPGVGKTTVTHQIVLARLGIGDTVLGWPVKPVLGRLLYLACDRPAQIARSLHRMVTEEHRQLLNDKLSIWRGPPPKDFAKDPLTLTKMAQDEGADTVFIDSLKDVALGLVDDDVGAGYNRARQHALAEGIELAELHHQRKGQGGIKPKALEDVYGSIWLTAGAGSVILIWGQGGDPLVDLIHLKQPADQIQQPVSISHDHDRGKSTLIGAVDILTLIRNAGNGLTAPETARAMYEKTPTKAETEKVRRKLDRYVKDGRIDKNDASYCRNEMT